MKKLLKNACLLFFVLLAAWVGGYAYFCWHILHIRPERAAENTDAIIVLTGGNHRVATGLELFAAGRSGHLFISGVNPQVTPQEVEALWKGGTELPSCCIALGQKSTSTIENAQEARDWMRENNFKSARLVTSGYHMPRALLEFRRALPGVDIVPHPVEKPDYAPDDKKFWILSFSEYNKTLWRWLVLNLGPA